MISVTQVLGTFADFSKVRPDVLAHAAKRGTEVHQACAAYAKGLWILALSAEAEPYFQSFRRWFDSMVEEVAAVEAELVDDVLGFKGHPDIIPRLKGDKLFSVIDYKTPAAKSRLWAAQLGAYKHLAEKAGYKIGRVATLRLKKDGSRALFDDYPLAAQDFEAFFHALQAARWFCGSQERR